MGKAHLIEAKRLDGAWVDGSIDGFRFQAKVFNEGSMYGINEGRVSKLMIWDEAKRQEHQNIFKGCIVNYDRGWDIEPTHADEKEILQAALEYLEAFPEV